MSDQELARDLGFLSAFTIGVGTMIGAGIFVLPGEAAGIAGPVVAVSFVIGGVVSVFTALSASELGTAMPVAGGSYFYVNRSLGPLFGSIAGIGNWIGLAFASAFYMIGFGRFVAPYVPLPEISIGFLVLSPEQIVGMVAGALFVGVNYVGARETGSVQNVIVITLVSILGVFTLVGFFDADMTTLKPLAPNGVGAILPGTALVFVSFLGFAKITTVTEELKNPGRNLPLAVIGSVVFVTLLYAVIMMVLMGVINWAELAASKTPVIDVARKAFESTLGLGSIGSGMILFAGLLGTASSANASILASSRINFAMGRDRLISDWLNEIHESFATPHRSILVTGAFILGAIAVGDIKSLAKAGAVLHLIVYGLLNIGLIVMREVDPEEYNPDFRVPFYPVVPILGAVTAFGLIGFMSEIELILSLVFVGIGIGWYLFYARINVERQGVLGEYLSEREISLPEAAGTVASVFNPENKRYRVMVPIANPTHVRDLVRLAGRIANERDGVVDVVHIVRVPDQTSLEYGMEHAKELDPESERLLEEARKNAEEYGVNIETHTIYSHRLYEEIFDAAETHQSDLLVMGWGEKSHGISGRLETALDEATHDLPCDVIGLRDREFDASRILLPTAGGPGSDLSATVARTLQAAEQSRVRLLHVSDDEEEGKTFLKSWAEEHDLGEAELEVVSGDVKSAVKRAAEDATLVILGSTERGLFSRMISGSVAMELATELDCSVLLTEKARHRSMFGRLFGSQG